LKSTFLSEKYLLIKVLTNDKITGPNKNANKPSTLNPGTSTDANQKQRPLMIKEKAPKVTKLRGRESREIAGFTNEFTRPIEAAAIKATGKVAMSTPGTAKSTTSRLKAVASRVNKVLIVN
jgi:recombination DNA repair RAD52 pathway protein